MDQILPSRASNASSFDGTPRADLVEVERVIERLFLLGHEDLLAFSTRYAMDRYCFLVASLMPISQGMLDE